MAQQEKPPVAQKEADPSVVADKTAATQQAQVTATKTERTSNAPLTGKVVERKQNREFEQPDLPKAEVQQLHVVEEDIHEKFYTVNSNRPMFRLLYPRGTVVLKAEYDLAVNGGEDTKADSEVTERN